MESVYLLVPLSIVLLGAAVWAFFWAVNKGQFEDLDEPSRIALEDDPPPADPAPLAEPAPRADPDQSSVSRSAD
jgi:cbb3-type cytochrome oxidase maturation protein